MRDIEQRYIILALTVAKPGPAQAAVAVGTAEAGPCGLELPTISEMNGKCWKGKKCAATSDASPCTTISTSTSAREEAPKGSFGSFAFGGPPYGGIARNISRHLGEPSNTLKFPQSLM